MKRLLPSLVLTIAALTAGAAEPIEGAFGLELGAVFEPATPPVSKFGFPDGYEFTPDKPDSTFSTYLVFISPTTHLIYQIAAIGRGDASSSHAKAQVLQDIAHQKYDPAGSGYIIDQGKRYISVLDRAYGLPKAAPASGSVPSAPGSASIDPSRKRIRVRRLPAFEPEHCYQVVYTDFVLLQQAVAEQSKTK